MKPGRRCSSLTKADLDHSWPMPSPVMMERLSAADAALYARRREAIDLYRTGRIYAEIEERCGMRRREVVRLLMRCKETASDGRISGYRPLVPQMRIQP